MALVNTAVNFAMKGRRVLAVDFDIEAPGLDTFDVFRSSKNVPGIIDFINDYLESGYSPNVSDYVKECPPIGNRNGKLWVMSAGRSKSYSAKFGQIDWGALYEKHDGFLLLEDLKEQWKNSYRPDYVLIDSRTGHTDTCGICTRQLPNAVVMLFFPNEQNLRGLSSVTSTIRAEADSGRNKSIKLHFVMSNVPDLDDEDSILKNMINRFQKQLDFRQEPLTVHRYDSLSLLNQVVFSRDRPRSRLSSEYEKIAQEISVHNHEDRDGALQFIERMRHPWKWPGIGRDSIQEDTSSEEAMLDKIEKAHCADGEVLFHLGRYKEFVGELDSAIFLLNQAIDAGYDVLEAYLIRSRIYELRKETDRMRDDLLHVLNLKQSNHHLLREAVSRLIRTSAAEPELIARTDALSSLEPDRKFLLAKRFNISDSEMRLAASLYEQIIEMSDIRDELRDETEHALGLIYMAFGKFSDAANLFRVEGCGRAGWPVENKFNFAMATWGETSAVESKLFKRVAEADRTRLEDNPTPNYLQCMTIVYWVLGNKATALDYAERAIEAIVECHRSTEFSYWQYRQVESKKFKKDMKEIRTLIEINHPLRPRFVSLPDASARN